jgi:hypothetical protein
MRLGDVGTMQDGVFERTTSLADLGVSFRTRRDARQKVFSHRTKGSIRVETKVAGTAGGLLGEAEAGLIIAADGAAGVLIDAQDCAIHSIENLDEVGNEVLTRHRSGIWDATRCVVYEVVEAGCTTVVVLEGSGAQIVLRAASPVGSDALVPASIAAGFGVVREQAVGLRVIAEKGLVPLYRVAGVRKPLFGRTSFAARRLQDIGHDESEPYVFAELTD